MSSGSNNITASPIQNFQMLMYEPVRTDTTALVEAVLANPLFFQEIDNFLESSITGTANEVIVTYVDGLTVLSTPQPIGTGSSVTFGALTTATGPVLHNLGAGNLFTLQQSGTTFLQAGTGVSGYNVNMTNVYLMLASPGASNIFIGTSAGNSSAAGVVAIGPNCAGGAGGTTNSIFMGHSVCPVIPPSNAVVIGPFALGAYATGGTAAGVVCVGTSALESLTTGDVANSVVLGNSALTSATTALVYNSVFIGQNVLEFATVGNLTSNVVIGTSAMSQITSNAAANMNVVIGTSAINSQTGIALTNSVAIGTSVSTSGASTVTNAVAIGANAVVANSNNIAIGYGASATSGTNLIAIGQNAVATQSHSMILGVVGTTSAAGVQVGVGTTAPVAMMHIVDSVYGSDTNIMLQCDDSHSGTWFSVDHSGVMFPNPSFTGYTPSYFPGYEASTGMSLSFTGPWAGQVSVPAQFVMIGNSVTLSLDGFQQNQTSTGPAMSTIPVPFGLTTIGQNVVTVAIFNNSAPGLVAGIANITVSGGVTSIAISPLSGFFSGAGTAGWNQIAFTYII